MTSPPKQITVRCPKCSETYTDWIRPSINLSLGEEWTEEEIEEATTVVCPKCSTRVDPGSLIVEMDEHGDETWTFQGVER